MANMQLCLLAAIVLFSHGVEVYGRHIPSPSPKHIPGHLPTEVKGKFSTSGNFAKDVNDVHAHQTKTGTSTATATGGASGSKTHHKIDTLGGGAVHVGSNGGGHGTGSGKAFTGAASKVGSTVSGGGAVANTNSRGKGFGSGGSFGDGTAVDKKNKDITTGDATGQALANGGNGGRSTTKVKAAGGGSVKGLNTISGTAIHGNAHAKNKADASAGGVGTITAENKKNGKDTITGTSVGGGASDSNRHGSSADAKGSSVTGGQAGKTFIATKGKGDAWARNRGDATGDGFGHGSSSDKPYGPKNSHANTDATATANKQGSTGGGKGTGHGFAVTGVKGSTKTVSESDALVKTGTLNKPTKGTKAWAGSSHNAVLSGGKGSVDASGHASASAGPHGGTAGAGGVANSNKKVG